MMAEVRNKCNACKVTGLDPIGEIQTVYLNSNGWGLNQQTFAVNQQT